MHTLQVFFDFDPQTEIILVLPQAQQQYWKELCIIHSFTIVHQIADGGPTRFHSVQNGLNYINHHGIIMIHDGVRPLVNHETLSRCCLMAEQSGNAIPVLPVTESLRMLKGTNSMAVDRSIYYSVQTPQTFQSDQIIKAFKQPYEPTFTDDASVAEKAGFHINMVEGNSTNIKITTPSDLVIAETFIKLNQPFLKKENG
jgi:2-C-methyl-D-erythritol 4-phosphate cytidylyltransferase